VSNRSEVKRALRQVRRMPCLVMDTEETADWCHPLSKCRQTLGRSRSCDIRIKNPSVSRVHAEIRWEDDTFVLCDLGSKNGSYHNGRRVNEVAFGVGDSLRLARVKLLVVSRLRLQVRGHVESTTHNIEVPPDASAELQTLIDLANQFSLSRAQCRVLHALLKGFSDAEAAARLHLSPHTVHSHAKTIYQALGVHSLAELLVRFWSDSVTQRKANRRKIKSETRQKRLL
jgi:DNA-binding CsgD family transcriptional regulator